MGKRLDFESEFYCTQCGQRGLPILRKKGQLREVGHLKKIFCLNCEVQTNHAEVRPYTKYDFEMFRLEYEYDNFDKNGQRKRTLGQLKELIHNGQIERQKSISDVRDPR